MWLCVCVNACVIVRSFACLIVRSFGCLCAGCFFGCLSLSSFVAWLAWLAGEGKEGRKEGRTYSIECKLDNQAKGTRPPRNRF